MRKYSGIMTTLNLPNELEERLLRECRKPTPEHPNGMSIPDYVAMVLTERWKADDAIFEDRDPRDSAGQAFLQSQ